MKLSYMLVIMCLLSASLRGQAVLNGTGYIDLTGATTFTPSTVPGNRFLWLPAKSAFRFGHFSSALTTDSIGIYSVAGGRESSASGESSVAIGTDARATGWGAIALGGLMEGGPQASGIFAVAIGTATISSDQGTLALGYGQALAQNAVAINGGAFGEQSISLGGIAYGRSAIALATQAEAVGYESIAIGVLTVTNAQNSVAVGSYNKGLKKDGSLPEPSTPALDDPIFEIGNGDYIGGDRNNALTVYRDGTIRMSKASGGISMGQFQ